MRRLACLAVGTALVVLGESVLFALDAAYVAFVAVRARVCRR